MPAKAKWLILLINGKYKVQGRKPSCVHWYKKQTIAVWDDKATADKYCNDLNEIKERKLIYN